MRQLTHGPRHHFFGRAGVSPWNAPGTRLVCLETAFHGRAPLPGERAGIGIVDPNTGGFSAIATTAAWNFTHGAMLEWSHQSPGDEILFNDMVDGSPVGVRLNVHTGARQTYMRPIVAAGGEGARAASVNLGRIARLVPADAIAGATDPLADETAPDGDGLSIVSLSTGMHRLLVPLAALADHARAKHAELRRREFWIDNAVFNPGGRRLIFSVFAGGHGARPDCALWTVGVDGADLREVLPFGRGATRGAWIDAANCVAVFRGDDGRLALRVFADASPLVSTPMPCDIAGPVGVTPSPDGTRLAIESENTRRRLKTLTLVEPATAGSTVIVEMRYLDEALFQGAARCDLGARWNPAGNALCFDAATIEGTRQMHVVNVEREK